MPGLYQKALILLQREGGADKELQADISFDPESGISREDQKDILAQIEKVAIKSRIEVTPQLFTIRALKKGILFPFLVNILSLAVLASGIAALYFLFQRGETTLLQEGTAITTAEGKLIEELKKESEQRLVEKNKEIAQIQDHLEVINRERADLQANMDSKIQEREQVLRQALYVELEVEREKLKRQGISEEAISKRLEELESKKSAEYNLELEIFKQEAEAERRRIENNLKALQEEYRNNLASADAERRKVLDESKKREEELRSQLDSRTKALESEKAEAERELRRITEQREQESRVIDHLIGLYNVVNTNIRSNELEQALFNLDAIRNYLNQEEIVTLPAVLKRREVEFFVIDSISSMVEAEMKEDEVDTTSLIASANQISEIKSLVLEADRLYRGGEIEGAQKLYEEALGLIPEINKSHNFFTSREQQAEEARQRRLEQYIAAAESAFARNNFAESLDQYTRALEYLPEDPAAIENMISQVRQAGFDLAFRGLKQDESGKATGPLAEADRFFERGRYSQAMLAYIDVAARYPYSSQVEAALTGIQRSAEARNDIARQEMTELQNTMRSRLGELEQNLKGKISQLESLQNKQSLLSSQIETLNREKDTLNREKDDLSQVVEELRQAPPPPPVVEPAVTDREEAERLKQIERNYTAIREMYTRYAAREDDILGNQGDDGLIQTKLYLNSFLGSTEIEGVFPGLWGRIKRYDLAFEMAGRSAAMEDVIDIVYTTAIRNEPESREQFLNDEIERYRGDAIMVELLGELKELIQP